MNTLLISAAVVAIVGLLFLRHFHNTAWKVLAPTADSEEVINEIGMRVG